MRTLIDSVSRQTRRVRAAVLTPGTRLAARLRTVARGELAALAVAAVVTVVGPATVFAYGRWMDRHVVVVHATQWQYAPGVLHARAGVPLRIRLESDDVVHGFRIIGLDAQVTELIPGKSMELTVTAPKPGTYIYMCTTFCGLKHARMIGKLIVTPP